LALNRGDTLKIRLMNKLPSLNPIKVTHSAGPGEANLPLNPTNLHTHGLLVEAPPTLSDPTFRDYVFVQNFNSANGAPIPQTHQHGSIKMDVVYNRISIPANHPSGLFWFYPHVHGLALNQVSSGMAGIITIGRIGDFARLDTNNALFPESNVRELAHTLSAVALARDPSIADLHVGALDRGPRDPVCRLFLTRVSGMGREGVIERGSINVLRVRRQMARDRIRQFLVGAIGHGCLLAGTARFEAVLWTQVGAGPHIPHRRTNQVFTMCVSTA